MLPLVLCVLAVQRGPELARRKRFDRPQPSSEFAGRQTPVAVEQAQKALCRGFSFQCVAFSAGGNDVAVRIAAPPHLRHHMIEAAHASGQPPQTIEARATFPRRLCFRRVNIASPAGHPEPSAGRRAGCCLAQNVGFQHPEEGPRSRDLSCPRIPAA